MRVFQLLFPFVAVLAIASQTCGDDLPTIADAQGLSEKGKYDEAAEVLQRIVRNEPENPDAWYLLGRELFLANKPAESVTAFDRYIALKPSHASRQWERGISCYYAEKYKAGAKQFADYQTYHAADVENAAWRFLCTAKVAGLETARKEILPIKGDRRTPMMEIYAMFKGELEPKDVMAAANKIDEEFLREQKDLKDDQLDGIKKGQMFYANLYIGLYEESRGNEESAKKHLLAADKLGDSPVLLVNRYMWQVARVHCLRYKSQD